MARPLNRLRFKDPKTPVSERFDDVYFADEVGVDESVYVYLEGTGALKAMREGAPCIRIAEVGFGVGLNFVLTLKAFLKETNESQSLHYVSAEQFPIEKEDLVQLYSAYPDLFPYAEKFLEQYPILTPGVHRLHLANHRVTLDLLIGDATDLFEKTDFRADFWYWDGFAPSKNPDAFSDALFTAVKKRSNIGACGTSFTAAGWVRRGLETLGFDVAKRPGFGKKRECIIATGPAPLPDLTPPWFSRVQFEVLKDKSQTIAILGAGLAGSAIARALADRGYAVEVYDPNGIAGRASSNSAALFNVQLSKLPNPISRFSQSSLAAFLRELKTLKIPTQMGIDRKDPTAAECLDGCDYPENFYEKTTDGVFLPECGIIHPQVLCATRLNHPLISVKFDRITKIERIDSQFKFFNSEHVQIGVASHVVYALGADTPLEETLLNDSLVQELPLRAIRGQTILLKPTESSRKLTQTRVEDGYVSPVAPDVTGHAFHLIGATYQAKEVLPDQEKIDTEKLLNEAKLKWTEFAECNESSVVSTKVGYRASTPDKLPLIGPLGGHEFAKQNFELALKGGKFPALPALHVSPREWVFTGLGSRGVTFSSLGAEILAAQMTGESLPIEHDLMEHIHPIRFTIRSLKRTTPSKI